MSSKTPLISIGLPVYNGERYLGDAIESILSQTLDDFELIIFDNASTDSTPEICEEYAKSDQRIKYYRNKMNLGAGPNYDNCFYKSLGKYFKWFAHDDMIEKSYLDRTVEAMEHNPQAVLCFTDVVRVDENNNKLSNHELDYPGIFATSQSSRFLSMLRYLRENECFFGLFRRSALEGSELHGNYMNSDLVLLAETALRGPFVKVEEPLFLHREHDNRYTRTVYPDRAGASLWFDTGRDPVKSYRALTLYKKYLQVIWKNVTDRDERVKCYGHLMRYALMKRNLKILFFDLVYFISPWIYYNVDSIRAADINTK